MTLRSPEFVGGLAESPILEAKDLSKEEREHLREVTNSLAANYEAEYSRLANHPWSEMVAELDDKTRQNEAILARLGRPAEARLAMALNRTLGGLPSRYLDSQRALSEFVSGYTKEERHGFRVTAAEWQGEAIMALNTLANVRMRSGDESRRLLDSFYYIVHQANRQLYGRDPERMEKSIGTMISGVYGPVAVTRLLQENDYDVWLPQPEVDVLKRVDIIFGKGTDGGMPEKMYLGQIKSTRSDSDEVNLLSEPGLLMTDEMAGWEALKHYTFELNGTPAIRDAGIDFSPVWAKISHAGLRDADDWRAGIADVAELPLDLREEGETTNART